MVHWHEDWLVRLPAALCRNIKVTEEEVKLRRLADDLADAQGTLRVRACMPAAQMFEWCMFSLTHPLAMFRAWWSSAYDSDAYNI